MPPRHARFVACVAAPAAAADVRREGHRAMRVLAVVADCGRVRVGRVGAPLDGARLRPRRRAHRSRRRDHRSRVGQSARALQDARRRRRRRRAVWDIESNSVSIVSRFGLTAELVAVGNRVKVAGNGGRQRRQRALAHEHDAAERRGDSVRRGRAAALVAADDRRRHSQRRRGGLAAISASFASGPMRRTRPCSGATTCR